MGNTSSSQSKDDCSETDTTVYGDSVQLQQDEDALMMTTPSGELRLRNDARLHLRKELSAPSRIDSNTKEGFNDQPESQELEAYGGALEGRDNMGRDKSRMNVDSAVALLQELTRNASPEQLAALQKAVSGQETQGGSTPAISRSSPLAAMVRRKSNFTPGVATRDTPAKLQKRSPPSNKSLNNPGQKRAGAKTWSPEMFSASPLAKLASLDGRRETPSPESRSVTPINLDKSFIGTQTLGTLRIMNGTASPEPSIRSGMGPRPLQSPIRDEDYCTASEGSGRTSPERASMHTSQSHQSFGEDHATTPRQSSPFRSNVEVSERSASYQHNNGSTHALGTRDSYSTLRDHTLRPAQSWHTAASVPISPSQMYMSEAVSNPFLPFPGSDAEENAIQGDEDAYDYLDRIHSQTPREIRGMEPIASDGLFDDTESVYSSKSSQLLHDNRRKEQTFELNEHPIDENESLKAFLPVQVPFERPQADSGYASSSSLRSTQDSSGQKPREMPRPKANMIYSDGPQAHQWAQQTKHFMPTAVRDISVSTTGAIKSTSPRASIESPSKPTTRLNLNPESFFKGPVNTTASAPVTPEKGHSPTRSGPKKLQKKRPASYHAHSAPLILPSATLMSIENVPRVPVHVATTFNERLRRQPGTDYLDHGETRDSVRTPSPIFDVAIRFPSPSRSPERLPPLAQQRARVSFGDRVMKPNMFRRKSQQGAEPHAGWPGFGRQNALPMGVSDFGSVAGSLGTSPYDLASVASGPRRRGPSSQPVTHPHQMSSMRVRGITGMTDKEASEFAQRRSRDRMANMANVLPPRPKSFYGHASDSFEALPSSNIRPRSFHSDQPPVPILSRHPEPEPEANNYQPDPVKDARWQQSADSYNPSTNDAGNIAEHQRDEGAGAGDLSGDPVDWTQSVQAWRTRRKSIGENLLQHEEPCEESTAKARPKSVGVDMRYQRSRGQHLPPVAEVLDLRKLLQGSSTPAPTENSLQTAKATSCDPANILHNFTQTQTRLTLLRSPSPAATITSVTSASTAANYSRTSSPVPQLPSIPTISPIEPYDGRSASPTPSVLERAAMFDNVAKSVIRTPSPFMDKGRAKSPVRGPRECLSPMSNFNVNSRALQSGQI